MIRNITHQKHHPFCFCLPSIYHWHKITWLVHRGLAEDS